MTCPEPVTCPEPEPCLNCETCLEPGKFYHYDIFGIISTIIIIIKVKFGALLAIKGEGVPSLIKFKAGDNN